MNRRLVSAAITVVLSAFAAQAQDSPPPSGAEHPADGGGAADPAAIDRVRQAAAALRDARTLSFRLKTSATGMLTSGTPVVDYSMRMLRQPSGGWQVHVAGEGRRRPAEEPQEVLALFDDTQITWVDHTARQVLTKTIRNARGPALQLVYVARITELLAAEPLAKEVVAAEATIEGQAEIDGTTCDIISLRGKPKSARSRWWISASDHLPRKMEKVIESTSMGGSTTMEFLEMKAGAPITPADLEIRPPDGYTPVDSTSPHIVSTPPLKTGDESATQPHAETAVTGEGEGSTPAAPTPGPSPATSETAAPLTPPAPAVHTPDNAPVDVPLVDETGAAIPLATLRGKPVVMLFLGSWSLPSREAIAQAQQLLANFGSQAPVIALGVRERFPEQLAEFIRSRGATPRIVPRGDEAARQLDARVMPAVVILDSQGMVHKTYQGAKAADWTEIAQELTSMGLTPSQPAAAPISPAPPPAGETPAGSTEK